MQFRLEQSMRWFGPHDPVTLTDIRQAGCTNVVSALHAIQPGEIWDENAISDYKALINKAHLDWHVVESLPVHEDIKAGKGDLTRLYENYRQSIRNLGKAGIRVITYNFMPVFDWFRSDVAFTLDDGAQTLRYDPLEVALFDIHLLGRTGAEKDYSADTVARAKRAAENLDPGQKQRMMKSMLMALPGSKEALTVDYVRSLMGRFSDVGQEELRTNLVQFLKEVVPAAKEAGVKLAIHPDDPPFPIMGLPRVVGNADDFEYFLEAVPDVENGLCFCTGSLGASRANDIPAMFDRWSDRVHFLHLRNTRHFPDGSFIEAPHLEGDTDMFALMHRIVTAMHDQQRSIPMRPDHGYKMTHEKHVQSYPGYSYAGRAKGLAELRGLELALQRSSQ